MIAGCIKKVINAILLAESAKYSEDPSFKMTLSRMVDMTYRFNSGVMTLTLDRLKEISDPSYWANAAKPVSAITES